MMKFAVNYSPQAAELLAAGKISVDLFKCPAWPEVVDEVGKRHPVYVHFPLNIGLGIGDAFDSEVKGPADWGKVEQLLEQTDTPFVNLHLLGLTEDYSGIPMDTTAPAHYDLLVGNAIRDAEAVVRRFGAERVIVENTRWLAGRSLRPLFTARAICAVIEAVDCGFLLDISHARIAADDLGLDEREYIAALPLDRVRELHNTGIHRIEGHWLEMLQGLMPEKAALWAGNLQDHLPMQAGDWAFLEWALGEVQAGRWGSPEIFAVEYGGIGRFFAATTDVDVLTAQVPRFSAMLQRVSVPVTS